MRIPPKRRPKAWKARRGRPALARQEDDRLRYEVERSFAWLGNYRRLLIRWERRAGLYQGFFTVALALIRIKRFFPAQCAQRQ